MSGFQFPLRHGGVVSWKGADRSFKICIRMQELLSRSKLKKTEMQEKTIVDEKTVPKRNDLAVQKLLDVKRQKAYMHLLPEKQPKQKSTKKSSRSKISKYWWINSRKTYPYL